MLVQGAQSKAVHFSTPAFKPTSELDRSGRPLFSGRCANCGGRVVVPFKPRRGKQQGSMQCSNGRRGFPVSPDFLIPGGVLLSGREVFWLDCMLFYSNRSIAATRAKLQRQASKFVTNYGEGALVFALGFCEGVCIEEVLMLDAEPFEETLGPMWDSLLADFPSISGSDRG